MATDSPELTRIAAEALDIAKSAAQEPTTAHLLLATFTVPGAADVLLRERGCDEDRVLEELARARPSEEPGLFLQALERARQLADDCASQRAEGLHLLVALTRLSRSAATALLDRLVNLASLRTTALGYLTGAVPRRRVVREEVRVGTQERRAFASPAPVVPRAPAPELEGPPAATSTPASTSTSTSTPTPISAPTSTSTSISAPTPTSTSTSEAAARWALDPR